MSKNSEIERKKCSFTFGYLHLFRVLKIGKKVEKVLKNGKFQNKERRSMHSGIDFCQVTFSFSLFFSLLALALRVEIIFEQASFGVLFFFKFDAQLAKSSCERLSQRNGLNTPKNCIFWKYIVGGLLLHTGAGWGLIFWTMSFYNPKKFISRSF